MSHLSPPERDNYRSAHGADQFPVPEATGNPWKSCLNPLLEEDRLKCEAWRDEVQNLLLFAGLFSAVVTAFVVQSYQYLQPNNNNSMALLLSLISQNSALPGISFRDSCSPGERIGIPQAGDSYYPSASTIRVNICWFISLILSLMTVLVGIVALQWIREYQKYPTNLLPKRAFATRNLRVEGLEQWWVPEIFAGLPLLLQSALVLFLVGLTDFLLHLNIIVAWPAIAMTGVTLLFLIVTTILPPVQALWLFNTAKSTTIPAPCPYKSPQSWAFFRIMSSSYFRFVLNLVGDASFHILVAPVSAIALVDRILGGRDRLWTWISYLHVTLKLKSLGSMRDWSELDGFWMDERQRLYTNSTEPATYFKKTIGNIDCDAARGVAHVVDGRAGEDSIAVAIYHCFQELPGTVIGDDIFKLMTQRLPQWMTSGQAARMLTATCHQDSRKVKDENELFLLARLPQTSIVDPIHFFRRRQLQLFIRVLRHIFADRNTTAQKGLKAIGARHVPKKPVDPGKLLIPTCMKTVQRVTALPRPLLLDIQEQLIEVFQGLVYKTIALENEAYGAEFCFQSEQVLGDSMQLMRIITLSVIKLTKESSSNRSMMALSSLAKLLRILNQQVEKRSRMSGRPAVYVSILYVSRFDANDWGIISRSAPDFSASFKNLVESLEDIGLKTFNFALHRAFYRKRCEDIVNQIKGRPSSRSTVTEEGADIQILVELVPKDLEDENCIEVLAYPRYEQDEAVAEISRDTLYYKEGRQSLNRRHGSVNNQLPRYPERAKIRSPTTGKAGPSQVEGRKNF